MSIALRTLGSLFALSFVLAAGDADARPPAYVIHASFTTGLHNASGKVECVDEACQETLGQVVAEGESDAFDAPITIAIREYRDRHGLSIKELEELAHKSEKRRGGGTERRGVSGQIAGHPATEIWSSDKPCTPELHARVLIALPDKVVEVEANAKSEDKEFPAEAFEAMDSVLRGVRIRRLADLSIDPSITRPDDAIVKPGDFVCAPHVQ